MSWSDTSFPVIPEWHGCDGRLYCSESSSQWLPVELWDRSASSPSSSCRECMVRWSGVNGKKSYGDAWRAR